MKNTIKDKQNSEETIKSICGDNQKEVLLL